MFPAAKRRQRPERPSGGPFKKRKPFSGNNGENKHGSTSPHRSGPGGKPRDRMGGDRDRKEGKKFGDGGKSFGKMSPGGKRFGGKTFGDGANGLEDRGMYSFMIGHWYSNKSAGGLDENAMM